MAYEAHKWKIGEEITSEKLNHIEKGIAAGGDIQTNITDPQDGQTLKYDAASGKWANAEGGGILIVNINYEEGNGYTMDKTWKQIYDEFAGGTTLMFKEEIESEYGHMITFSNLKEIKRDTQIFEGQTTTNYSVSTSAKTLETQSENGYPYSPE